MLNCFLVKVEDSKLCFYFILFHFNFNFNLIILDFGLEYSIISHVIVKALVA